MPPTVTAPPWTEQALAAIEEEHRGLPGPGVLGNAVLGTC